VRVELGEDVVAWRMERMAGMYNGVRARRGEVRGLRDKERRFVVVRSIFLQVTGGCCYWLVLGSKAMMMVEEFYSVVL
jgi:hypothetical protein